MSNGEQRYQPCPQCDSTDGYTIYPDHGHCFVCEYHPWFDDDNDSKDKEEATVPETTPVELTQVTRSIRKVPVEVMELYGITVGVDGEGNEVQHNYPYPDGKYKYRTLPKSFKASGPLNSLFGMDKFNAGSSKFVTIVEGELDAAATYHMLGNKSPVVSLPSASVGPNLLKPMHPYLDSFSQIVVATDSDEAGDKVARKIAAAFPNKVYRVNMTSFKDPCDYLMNGKATEFKFSWINRKKYTPDNLYNTPDDFVKILKDTEVNSYIPTPFEDLNSAIKGLLKGHVTLITAMEGQGKTEIIRAFEYDILKNHPDVSIGVIHMEESKKTTLLGYLCYELQKNVRDSEDMGDVTEQELEDTIKELTKGERLYLMDMGKDEEPQAILEHINYLSEVCGCDYIFIDHINQLVANSADGDDTKTLDYISTKMEKFATDLNVGLVVVAHVNDNGQTRSSRMIGKAASIRIDLKRDHMNEDSEVRNTTRLSISKNRPFSQTGYGGDLFFDVQTFTVKEKEYE